MAKATRLLLAVSTCALMGCFSATGYHPVSFTGGYLDQQIGEATYLVTFKANSYTEVETVQNYLLYRCAELTVAKGYDHFIILDQATDLRHIYGVKPEMRATIQMGKGPKPGDNPRANDAREVMKYLAPRINRQGS